MVTGASFSVAFAAVLSLVAVPVRPENDATPGSLVPCPYTQAEIKTELGLEVDPGVSSDMQGPAAREVGCMYPVKNSYLAFFVQRTWDPNGESAPAQGAYGSAKLIVGDADEATWLPAEDKEKPHLKLTYRRGKVRTTVDVHGSYFNEGTMTPKLQHLRRVP